MAPQGAHRHVEKLVVHHRSKAIDILVGCCNDNVEVWQQVLACLAESETGQQDGRASASRVNIENGLSVATTSPVDSRQSHFSASPPSRDRLSHRRPSLAGPPPAFTPPRSETSHSSSNKVKLGEYMLLLVYDGSHVKEKPLRMRTAPFQHSVIRKQVLQKRIPDCSLDQLDECYVLVTRAANPHGGTEVPASHSVELTWRRPDSDSSHSTTFYVVPDSVMDTDVLLGYLDSGEDHSPMVSHSQHRQNFTMGGGYTQNAQPSALFQPSNSFHRSATMGNESDSATHVPQRQQHPHALMESFLDRQQSNVVAQEQPLRSHRAPATTIFDPRSARTEHPQTLRPSTAPTTMALGSHENSANDKVRLCFSWDTTTMNMWLDLCSSGESFFKEFQELVEERKGIFDRAGMILSLRKDKATPDSEAYHLSFNVDELETDWETTLDWVKENKRDKGPHIYGRIQVGAG